MVADLTLARVIIPLMLAAERVSLIIFADVDARSEEVYSGWGPIPASARAAKGSPGNCSLEVPTSPFLGLRLVSLGS